GPAAIIAEASGKLRWRRVPRARVRMPGILERRVQTRDSGVSQREFVALSRGRCDGPFQSALPGTGHATVRKLVRSRSKTVPIAASAPAQTANARFTSHPGA